MLVNSSTRDHRRIGAAVVAMTALLAASPALAQDDGFPDLIFNIIDNDLRICPGDGSGDFSDCPTSLDSRRASRFATGDLNGDGIFDIAASTYIGRKNLVYLSDGMGGYILTEPTHAHHDSRAVTMGDVDRDGDLDVFFGVGGALKPDQICLNDGSGTLTCSDICPTGRVSNRAEMDDFNNDGNLDVIVARDNGVVLLALGTGTGTFNCVERGPGNGFGLGVGDVDNDGNLDAFIGRDTRHLVLCLGDGVDDFTSCNNIVRLPSGRPVSIELRDFNGDDNLDAVVAAAAGDKHLCIGDGAGGFSCAAIAPLDGVDRRDVDAGDIDLDGDVDAVFAGLAPGTTQVCLNDGTGSFSCSNTPFSSGSLALTTAVPPPPCDACSALAERDGKLDEIDVGIGKANSKLDDRSRFTSDAELGAQTSALTAEINGNGLAISAVGGAVADAKRSLDDLDDKLDQVQAALIDLTVSGGQATPALIIPACQSADGLLDALRQKLVESICDFVELDELDNIPAAYLSAGDRELGIATPVVPPFSNLCPPPPPVAIPCPPVTGSFRVAANKYLDGMSALTD